MKTLGVIGGMGPMATVRFYERVTVMTEAHTDQEHLDIIIHSIPSTPDRTAFLQGLSGESPVPAVLGACRKLDADGVGCIAIPCVTMSCFIELLRDGVSTPVIDMVEETVSVLSHAGVSSAGIMATDGTICSGRFQDALMSAGIRPIIPSDAAQANIMHIIYNDVKNNRPVECGRFASAADDLFSQGAECVILGCTELSMARRDCTLGHGFIDTVDVLARSSIIMCGAKVRDEYNALIS